ncbi:MAG: MraY family glycosyltransferase [Sedimentisphaerales bacterium]
MATAQSVIASFETTILTGDLSEIVSAPDKITPFKGTQILHFIDTSQNFSAGYRGELWQIIHISPCVALVSAEKVVAVPGLKFLFFLFGASFITSVILVRIAILVAWRIDLISYPNPIVHNHERPVALGGGVAVVLTLLLFFSILTLLGLMPRRILLGVLPVFALGCIDDAISLRPLQKFILECASIIAYLIVLPFPFWSLPLVGMFLLSSMNAWNLVDIMDGLLGWIAINCMLGIAGVLFLADAEHSGMVPLAITVVGTIAGFLIWNSYPAKVYMGDAGSLSLGMLFGILVLEAFSSNPRLGIPLLFTGLIPFFELAFLVVVRTKKKIPFYRGSPDHFALRMLHRGYSVPFIVRAVIFTGLATSGLAWIIVWFQTNWWISGSAMFITLVAVIISYRYFSALPTLGEKS